MLDTERCAKDVLGKYLLHERIGAGGMAEVFRASYSPEGGFEKTVAVKKILPAYAGDQNFLTLFREEAALCSRLNHPNVVQVMDFGRFGETYFLAMEYIEGLSLKKVIDAHRLGLPITAVAHLGYELLRALEYVHERTGVDGEPLSLAHRDVNPPNVLLSTVGEVKLTDFGIARARSHVRSTQVGTSGASRATSPRSSSPTSRSMGAPISSPSASRFTSASRVSRCSAMAAMRARPTRCSRRPFGLRLSRGPTCRRNSTRSS